MTNVRWDVTMSLDGFIADPNNSPGRLFDWYFKGDTPSTYGSAYGFKLSSEGAKYFDEGVKMIGAIVAGKRTYEVSEAWGRSFFIPVPLFVVTHKPPLRAPKGSTKFTFVTDGIQSAIKQAKTTAHNKIVSIMGANVANQCIEDRLLDELRVHVAPFLLGDGVRLFSHSGAHLVELERTGVIKSSSSVMHIHHRVIK